MVRVSSGGVVFVDGVCGWCWCWRVVSELAGGDGVGVCGWCWCPWVVLLVLIGLVVVMLLVVLMVVVGSGG